MHVKFFFFTSSLFFIIFIFYREYTTNSTVDCAKTWGEFKVIQTWSKTKNGRKPVSRQSLQKPLSGGMRVKRWGFTSSIDAAVAHYN